MKVKALFVVLSILLGTISVVAQEQKFKIGVFATAAEIKSLFPVTNEELTNYNPNLSAELMATVGTTRKFRFSSGPSYRRNFETGTNTLHLAGQVSYHYSVFEPFARFSAGVDYVDGISNRTFSREILIGGDVNAGRISFRPLAVGFKRSGKFLAPAERTFQSGVGFNF